MDEAAAAKRIIGLLDLTSLEENDTEAKIAALCAKAATPFGNVAAVCVYGRFVAQCKSALDGTGIKVATVVNFPHGGTDVTAAAEEARTYVAAGADEIDTVLPYAAFAAGNVDVARALVAACRAACNGKTLKVILETGTLTPDQIAAASRLALEAGADFIKTSTGKRQPAATPEAAKIMLETIRNHGGGAFKAAGGVRTLEQAQGYVALAEGILGAGWATAAHFRIGASGLLDDLLGHLGGPTGAGKSAY